MTKIAEKKFAKIPFVVSTTSSGHVLDESLWDVTKKPELKPTETWIIYLQIYLPVKDYQVRKTQITPPYSKDCDNKDAWMRGKLYALSKC